MNSNLGYWHCLSNVKGLGPLRFKTLLALFKEPEEIYNLSLEQLLCIKGFDEKIAKEVIASKSKLEQCINKMNSEQQKALLLNVKVLTLNDKTYPHSLKKTSACSPLLYTRGNFDLLQKDNKAIAIVGTRQISDYGAYVTLDLSRKLASNGWTIVSGMAKGTDSIAHHGAISSSGTTFAVLGCGVDVVYPSEAKDLYNQILKNG